MLAEGVDPELLRPPINVMKLCLHPRGLAQRLLNRAEVHSAILGRVRRHARATAAPDIRRLYEELSSYPVPEGADRDERTGELYVPFRMLTPDAAELAFVSTVATFGSPLDISVESLMIESFFPADPATADYLRGLDSDQRLRAIAQRYPQALPYLGSG